MNVYNCGALTSGYYDDDNHWCPLKDDWAPLEKNDDVILRIAAGSDPHFGGRQYAPADKMRIVFNALEKTGGVDLFAVIGDLTDHGDGNMYREAMEIIRNSAFSDKIMISAGNHEFLANDTEDHEKRFFEMTGQDMCGLYYINGIPVIKISPTGDEEGNSYYKREEFILDAFRRIDSTGYKGIIIGLSHHRVPSDPDIMSDISWSETELRAFAAHPGLILFTGHSHSFFYNTREFIEQDRGFTHIRTGVLAHFYGPDTGVVNPETGREGYALTMNNENSCSLVLADILKNGTARICRLDISKGEYVFGNEDWTVDPHNRIFSRNREKGSYGADGGYPLFSEGATLTVSVLGNHDTALFSFPSASPASDMGYDYIWRYRLILTDNKGNRLVREVMNDAHMKVQRNRWEVPFTGLHPDTDYTAEVQAVSSYLMTASLVCEEKVNVGHMECIYPPSPVFEADMSSGSAEDRYGHELLAYPGDVYFEENREGKSFVFPGSGGIGYEFKEEDSVRLRYSFTYETFFMVNDTGPAQFVAGAYDSIQSGFRVMNGKLYLWGNFRSMNNESMQARLITGAPIESGVWYHAVAVYTGLELRLYLNGELKDRRSVTGGLDEPFGKDMKIYIGDFAGDDSFVNYPLRDGRVRLVRLYEGAMTDDDVTDAYKSIIKG